MVALTYWERSLLSRAWAAWTRHVTDVKAALLHLLRPGGLLVPTSTSPVDDPPPGRWREAQRGRASAGWITHRARAALGPGVVAEQSSEAEQGSEASRAAARGVGAHTSEPGSAQASLEGLLFVLRAEEHGRAGVLRRGVAGWRMSALAGSEEMREAFRRASRIKATARKGAVLGAWLACCRTRRRLGQALGALYRRCCARALRTHGLAWRDGARRRREYRRWVAERERARRRGLGLRALCWWRHGYLPTRQEHRRLVGAVRARAARRLCAAGLAGFLAVVLALVVCCDTPVTVSCQ